MIEGSAPKAKSSPMAEGCTFAIRCAYLGVMDQVLLRCVQQTRRGGPGQAATAKDKTGIE
jgi:hypothetical protein